MPTPIFLTAISLALGVAACGGNEGAGHVTVFAAASLSDAFEELGDVYSRQHGGAEVTFNFAASSELAAGINEGADADVFASADVANMEQIADRVEGEQRAFATNTLTMLTESGNPQEIESVEDLANPELIIASCDPEVPIGAYSQEVFEKAGVDVEVDSLEADVKAVVTKVTLGEADVGIVYTTDAVAAGDAAATVEIPDDLNVRAEYPIAALDGDGTAFRDLVLSDEGQAILAEHGFGAP